jgi:hypothetical protein
MDNADQRTPIEVPHGERSADQIINAEFIIAEAMILDLANGMGRIKYYPAARHAVSSLLAAGWTPPSSEGGDEAERLRKQLATMQAHMDENNAHMRRMHDQQQASELACQQMSSAALIQAQKLEQAVVEAVRGREEPEPTMTYSQVAKGLMKFSDLRHRVEKRELAKAAKAKPVETVAVTLPGLEGAS